MYLKPGENSRTCVSADRRVIPYHEPRLGCLLIALNTVRKESYARKRLKRLVSDYFDYCCCMFPHLMSYVELAEVQDSL